MKEMISSFQQEFLRYKNLAENALAQLEEKEFVALFGDASIAMYVSHIGGNLRSRFTHFLTTDGEKEWRNREEEFNLAVLNREYGEKMWQNGWQELESTLAQLNDDDLSKIVIIRKNELTVLSALSRSLAHTAYHVGQIVLLAKKQKGDSWKSLSIPRGQSSAYNANPTLETGVIPKKTNP